MEEYETNTSKDAFTLEQDDWFLQWNTLGLDCFEENHSRQLKKKCLNIENIDQKLMTELEKVKHNLMLLQDAFEKQMHELHYSQCQKEQLIVDLDGILLQLQEVEAKNSKLLQQVNEQSVSIQMIAQDFNINLSQNEETRQQLLNDLLHQDGNYLAKMQQLEKNESVCMTERDKLKIECDGIILELQDEEVKYTILNDQLDQQSKSQKKITEEFNMKLEQNEEIRLQLLRDLNNQDANYANQMQELQAKTIECLKLERLLEQERENMTCPICFCQWEGVGNHRLVALPCGHLFGYRCISNCLDRSGECPFCRSRAHSQQLIQIYVHQS